MHIRLLICIVNSIIISLLLHWQPLLAPSLRHGYKSLQRVPLVLVHLELVVLQGQIVFADQVDELVVSFVAHNSINKL